MGSTKLIIVIGGCGFLGKSLCRDLSNLNYNLVIADCNINMANILSNEINKSGGSTVPKYVDINNEESIIKLIRDCTEIFGDIHAVVNTAYPKNKNYGKRLEDVTYIDFCENLNLHLGSYFLVMKLFSLYFKSIGKGKIINIGSIYGTIAPKFTLYKDSTKTMPIEYAAIKSAINQISKYFAQYYKKDGIQVNVISPGGILASNDEKFAEKYNEHCGKIGMLSPKEITGVVNFLLSDSSNAITGQNIIVDDGFTL
jgi:NAD(P)-dependent dehydrogenase (short-subunit alcohol dehydrogenase family)